MPFCRTVFNNTHMQYSQLCIYVLFLHSPTVVEFEFNDSDKNGSEDTGVINVRVLQSVRTAIPITLTITPNEYSDRFGFDVPDSNLNSSNIATRMYMLHHTYVFMYYVKLLPVDSWFSWHMSLLYGVTHVMIVACYHPLPLSACMLNFDLVSILFSTSIPTSFNILVKMFLHLSLYQTTLNY